MALFRLETKKRWGTAEWGNRYYVNAADRNGAAAAGLAILHAERAASWNGVEFVGVRVSTAAVDGRTGRTFANTGQKFGALVYPNVPPIEVCVRALFEPGIKQPGVKFYHFGISGQEFLGPDQLHAQVTTRWQTVVNVCLEQGVCDALGGLYTSATVEGRAHVHQMYRAWAARAGVDQGD